MFHQGNYRPHMPMPPIQQPPEISPPFLQRPFQQPQMSPSMYYPAHQNPVQEGMPIHALQNGSANTNHINSYPPQAVHGNNLVNPVHIRHPNAAQVTAFPHHIRPPLMSHPGMEMAQAPPLPLPSSLKTAIPLHFPRIPPPFPSNEQPLYKMPSQSLPPQGIRPVMTPAPLPHSNFFLKDNFQPFSYSISTSPFFPPVSTFSPPPPPSHSPPPPPPLPPSSPPCMPPLPASPSSSFDPEDLKNNLQVTIVSHHSDTDSVLDENLCSKGEPAPKEEQLFTDGKSSELSTQPARPSDENVCQRIGVLCQFIGKHGPAFEEMVLERECGNPDFRFLFDVKRESSDEDEIAHKYFFWMRRKCIMEHGHPEWLKKDSLPSPVDGGAFCSSEDFDMDTDVCNADKGVLESKDNSRSPAGFRISIEDEAFSQHSPKESDEVNGWKRNDSFRKSPDLTAAEDDGGKDVGVSDVALGADTSVETAVGALKGQCEFAKLGMKEEADNDGIPTEGGDSFRLLQNYDSDDSSESDDDPELEDCSPERKSGPDCEQKRVDEGDTIVCDDMGENGETGSTPSVPVNGSAVSDLDGHDCKAVAVSSSASPVMRADAGDDDNDRKAVSDDADGQPPSTTDCIEPCTDENLKKPDEEIERKQPCELKLDEFGRMVKEDAMTDSDSHVSKKKSRNRSRSRSSSLDSRRQRWRGHSLWKRNDSRSRSPRRPTEMGPFQMRNDKRYTVECRYFAWGRCYNGSLCRYLHTGTEGSKHSRTNQPRQRPSSSAEATEIIQSFPVSTSFSAARAVPSKQPENHDSPAAEDKKPEFDVSGHTEPRTLPAPVNPSPVQHPFSFPPPLFSPSQPPPPPLPPPPFPPVNIQSTPPPSMTYAPPAAYPPLYQNPVPLPPPPPPPPLPLMNPAPPPPQIQMHPHHHFSIASHPQFRAENVMGFPVNNMGHQLPPPPPPLHLSSAVPLNNVTEQQQQFTGDRSHPERSCGDTIDWSTHVSRFSAHYNPYASTFDAPLRSKMSKIGRQGIVTAASPDKAFGDDQYDPIMDSIEAPPPPQLRTGLSHYRESGPVDVEESNKKREKKKKSKAVVVASSSHAVADATSDNDEWGGETADVGVGAVVNGSPSSSSTNPMNGGARGGEMEIDQVKRRKSTSSSGGSRSIKLFKVALANFVKDVLKPSWRQGNMTKDSFKTIVKKTVDKVSGAMKPRQIPRSQAKIDLFIDSSQRKLTKLVTGYVDKYASM